MAKHGLRFLGTPVSDGQLATIRLFIGAFLAVSRGGLFHPASSGSITHWLTIAAGVVFLLRAIGEFRFVGFFKTHRGTSFATLDTWLFSPLCVVVGASFLFIAHLP